LLWWDEEEKNRDALSEEKEQTKVIYHEQCDHPERDPHRDRLDL
jgi:hypothetical protein